MIYTAEQHQVYGYKRIMDTPGVFPIIDMGLGKTVMTCTAIQDLYKAGEIKKVLVIAPLRVADMVWTDEIDKWDHLHLKASKVLGTEKQRKKALAEKAHVYLINCENVVWLVAQYGSNWPFDMVVFDESSKFKNPQANRFRAVKLVMRYVKRVVCLTGTPVPNSLLDLWPQMFLVDQGKRLGESYTKYRDTYFNAGQRYGYIVYNYTLKKGDKILGKDFYEKEIYNLIRDVSFSMKTEDYKKLPERRDTKLYIDLPKAIQNKYDMFERELVLKIAEEKQINAINAAALFGKLLQFANGAVYDENKNFYVQHDEKIKALEEIVDELNGKSILVFCNFKHDKERILKHFKQAKALETSNDIRLWNEKKIPIFVLNPKSASHGLNMQFGGNYIFWFGNTCSAEEYEQGYKRVHRDGVTGFVNNVRCVTRHTIDERACDIVDYKTTNQDETKLMLKVTSDLLFKHTGRRI